jgi:hypothetical protein
LLSVIFETLIVDLIPIVVLSIRNWESLIKPFKVFFSKFNIENLKSKEISDIP